jgi:hypothetical protein
MTNEIYKNHKDYIGVTIKLAGMFDSREVFVYRYEANPMTRDLQRVGFELNLQSSMRPAPSWLNVVGVITLVERDGLDHLVLEVIDSRPMHSGTSVVCGPRGCYLGSNRQCGNRYYVRCAINYCCELHATGSITHEQEMLLDTLRERDR